MSGFKGRLDESGAVVKLIRDLHSQDALGLALSKK
jgi:hypothetical protein